MAEVFHSNPAVLQRLREGPLGPYVDAFASTLREQGYAAATVKAKIRFTVNFSRWLDQRGLTLVDVEEQSVASFLEDQGRQRCIRRGDRETLKVLLQRLRTSEAIAGPAAASADEIGSLVDGEFAPYLRQERALSEASLANILPVVRRFLRERFGTAAVLPEQLRPVDVSRFVLRHAYTFSPGQAKLMTTALRSLFRFLRQRGLILTDLAASVPSVANWRLAELPKSLEQDQVEQLLRGCDQGSTTGQRDYTILLLLARLGLRAGELVAMRLDDIDWEKGELTVRGKGGRQDRLPLFHDVGEALATYLRCGRPSCSTRRVFIRMRAPLRGFASSVAISTIVRRALCRAGMNPPRKGAHLLRHSLATQMLHKGASLGQIGEVLRHSVASTTEIYAKVDLASLHELAQPWPGGEA